MSASSIGAGRGGGYARYLESKTVAPERGDYYLTPDGQLTEAPGRWLSGAETLERLGVGPAGPVEGGELIALMEGRHPGTGRWLRPAGADGSRGGGIDVTFSATRPIFRAGRELGAFYRCALAKELVGEGYEVAAGSGRDGRYFEISGVPRALCEALSGRRREIVRAAERFRARHGRAPERGELRDLALENRKAKGLATRGDLQRVWIAAGECHGFGADQAVRLVGSPEPEVPERPVADVIEAKLTEREAIFDPRALRAVALEQTAGYLSPKQALDLARSMVAERRILTLEGGRMTTLAVRAREQAIERRATALARPADRDVGELAREIAVREVAERFGGPLSREQDTALRALSGPERLALLIGPAGTGKGVVIDAAARAEQTIGRELIGVAVSGSTAQRLGADSLALEGRTLTLDALVARASRGALEVGPDTTVFLDEAGMVDHERLDALIDLVERTGAKLVAVGDGKQLPSIGPGGMFDRLANRAPAAELADIHRTSDPGERKAWAALRGGEPERAMAHYRARGQLYFQNTREQAGEAAVQRWAELTQTRDPRQVALITDASNIEIDHLNARAQHLRAERGELGAREIPLPAHHYGLREGDLITLTATHKPPGRPRVENGARGQVARIDQDDRSLTIRLDGSERELRFAGKDLEHLRLAYAQHVYRQQGATVERAVVITGGWQTSRETAYVQASRARSGTEWFLAREELGQEGQDDRRVEQLAAKIRSSQRRTPSLALRERPAPDWEPGRESLGLRRFPRLADRLLRSRHRATRDRSVERTR